MPLHTPCSKKIISVPIGYPTNIPRVAPTPPSPAQAGAVATHPHLKVVAWTRCVHRASVCLHFHIIPGKDLLLDFSWKVTHVLLSICLITFLIRALSEFGTPG